MCVVAVCGVISHPQLYIFVLMLRPALTKA